MAGGDWHLYCSIASKARNRIRSNRIESNRIDAPRQSSRAVVPAFLSLFFLFCPLFVFFWPKQSRVFFLPNFPKSAVVPFPQDEEEYAAAITKKFNWDILRDCDNGATLRTYLSRRLHCDPMMISKKHAESSETGLLCKLVKKSHTQNYSKDKMGIRSLQVTWSTYVIKLRHNHIIDIAHPNFTRIFLIKSLSALLFQSLHQRRLFRFFFASRFL